jgi:hypothetical protein
MKTKDEIERMVKADLEEKERIRKERWENLKPFKDERDVPSLPIPMTLYYVEKLVKAGAILKKDLIDGKTYYGDCRNANRARWDTERNVFVYKRTKFGYVYDEDINHFEDDNGYDLFVPIREDTNVGKIN